MKVHSFRVSDRELATYKRLASRDGLELSAWIRTALNEVVAVEEARLRHGEAERLERERIQAAMRGSR